MNKDKSQNSKDNSTTDSPKEPKCDLVQSNKKKIYNQPQLIEYGSIRSITQNGRSRAGFDFFGGRRTIT